MDYTDIRFELDAGVATVTLHRPEQLNAFTGAMGRELGDAYCRCDSDDSVRAVVLTGAGRAFCAGADMSGGSNTFDTPEQSDFSAAGFDPPAWRVRKPVIAAVNGHAVGIGLTMALQCDIRLVARDAKYGILQVRRGVMPDAYSHWTLPRLVGMEHAADLMLTGRKIQGEEAVQMGMASRALPADQVLPEALKIARDIADNTAPLSVAVTKKLLWESWQLDPSQVERRETRLHEHLMGAADALEGGLAYVERRKPNWTLRVSRDWPDWPED